MSKSQAKKNEPRKKKEGKKRKGKGEHERSLECGNCIKFKTAFSGEKTWKNGVSESLSHFRLKK